MFTQQPSALDLASHTGPRAVKRCIGYVDLESPCELVNGLSS